MTFVQCQHIGCIIPQEVGMEIPYLPVATATWQVEEVVFESVGPAMGYKNDSAYAHAGLALLSLQRR